MRAHWMTWWLECFHAYKCLYRQHVMTKRMKLLIDGIETVLHISRQATAALSPPETHYNLIYWNGEWEAVGFREILPSHVNEHITHIVCALHTEAWTTRMRGMQTSVDGYSLFIYRLASETLSIFHLPARSSTKWTKKIGRFVWQLYELHSSKSSMGARCSWSISGSINLNYVHKLIH